MPKTNSPQTHDELDELNLKLMQDNAALVVLLEQSVLFARRQTEALAGITQMARGLTRNEGLAKDRARLAATLEIFSAECAAEVEAHMGSLMAVSALQQTAAMGEGRRNPWPFMVSANVH